MAGGGRGARPSGGLTPGAVISGAWAADMAGMLPQHRPPRLTLRARPQPSRGRTMLALRHDLLHLDMSTLATAASTAAPGFELACSTIAAFAGCACRWRSDDELNRLEGFVAGRRPVRRGELLFPHRRAPTRWYAVRTRLFKARCLPRRARTGGRLPWPANCSA